MFIIFTASNNCVSLHFNNLKLEIEESKIEFNIVIANRICVYVR